MVNAWIVSDITKIIFKIFKCKKVNRNIPYICNVIDPATLLTKDQSDRGWINLVVLIFPFHIIFSSDLTLLELGMHHITW